jgi:Caspase domain
MPIVQVFIARAAIKNIALAVSIVCSAVPFAVHGQTPVQPDRNLVVQTTAPAVAAKNQRVALVLGNANYKDAPLTNPVNDARAISAALQEAGFTVILRENTDQRAMLAALREFGDKLRGGGTGLFYYAGHGMQIKGRNYLIPVGANVEREDEVAYSAVDAQAVLDKMEAAGNAANIMILDACRNNPFTRSTRSGQAGLAQMDAPVGTLVAFATSPGMVASDGAGANGLYTQHLLTAMRQSGSKVEDVFKQVRANVRRDSQGKQVPWESTSMEGDFYFKGGASVATAAAVDSSIAVENALWDAVKNSTLPIELRAYLNRFPTGRYAQTAQQKLDFIHGKALTTGVVANVAKPVNSAPSAQSNALPNADSSDQTAIDRRTQELLNGLSVPAAAVQASPRPVAVTNSFGYTVGDRWRYQKVDKFKGEVVENISIVIDGMDSNGDLRINKGGAVWSPKGSALYSRVADRERFFSDSFNQYPAVLAAGAKTNIEYTIDSKFKDGRKLREISKGTMVVKGQEKVKTPAGEFDAWLVEREIFWRIENSNDNGRYNQVSWYVPSLRRYVAWEEESRNANGSFNRRERYELTSFSVRGADQALSQR